MRETTGAGQTHQTHTGLYQKPQCQPDQAHTHTHTHTHTHSLSFSIYTHSICDTNTNTQSVQQKHTLSHTNTHSHMTYSQIDKCTQTFTHSHKTHNEVRTQALGVSVRARELQRGAYPPERAVLCFKESGRHAKWI